VLASAMLTLKIHRFEVTAAVVLALATAAAGGWILVQLSGLNVPAHCIDGWLVTGPEGRLECAEPMSEWAAVMGQQGDRFFWAMIALPFAVGLLGGVPLVARDLETQTSQIAWWLNASRLRWFARHALYVGFPLVVGLAIASIVALAVADLDEAWGKPAFARIGTQGPLVLARGLGAFGLATLVGAMLGNTLRALVVGGALSLALIISVPQAQAFWLQSLPREVIGEVSPQTGEMAVTPGAITTGWGYRSPDGSIVDEEQSGYEPVQLGVRQETAMGWQVYEFGLYAVISVGTLVLAAAVVNSRRPL
jgi:hypothetical protein